MITLYQFPVRFNVPNFSPFCMKVEAFLRIADIPFEIVSTSETQKAPKGKLPFIRDNGISVADSEFIIQYLENKHDFQVDGHLGEQQKAIHHAFSRMLDEHLYWAILYSRFVDEKNWPCVKNRLFGHIPPPVSTVMANQLRHSKQKQLEQHGLGRHNSEEVYKKASKDIAALSVLLGDHQWFGRDFISKLDLVAVAYLSNILIEELPSPLADAVKQHDNLTRYCQRSQAIIFSDFKAPKKPLF